MLVINDQNNSIQMNNITFMFRHDSQFMRNVLVNLTREDVCEDMQLGNPGDIRYTENAHAIRLCRVIKEYGAFDYWLCRSGGGDHYVIVQTNQDQHYTTYAVSVGVIPTLTSFAA